MHQINHLNLEQEIGSKQLMNQEGHILVMIFKTTMLRSTLCGYADAYILVKGTIAITGAGDNDAAKRLDERSKGVIFKNCVPFTKCISRINNTDIYTAQVLIL